MFLFDERFAKKRQSAGRLRILSPLSRSRIGTNNASDGSSIDAPVTTTILAAYAVGHGGGKHGGAITRC
jgi:hypothetical protein